MQWNGARQGSKRVDGEVTCTIAVYDGYIHLQTSQPVNWVKLTQSNGLP